MNAAQKLCPEPKIADGPYRISQFAISAPCEEGVLLYHTLTGELLLLSEEEFRVSADGGAAGEDLKVRRFLVPEEQDECALYESVIRVLRRDRKQGRSPCGGSCGHCPMAGSCHKSL